MTLSARYGRLVHYAPALGLPAQTLDVLVTGGTPPYHAAFRITPPGTPPRLLPYTASTNPFSYGPPESGDPYFGVDATGTWYARAEVDGVVSNQVSWEVHWYPVHVIR